MISGFFGKITPEFRYEKETGKSNEILSGCKDFDPKIKLSLSKNKNRFFENIFSLYLSFYSMF